MGLSVHSTITSVDILELKARVKSEMARRKYKNSLSHLNTNFSVSANVGDKAMMAHYNETVGYINLIQPTGVSNDLIRALDTASAILNNSRAVDITVNSESCAYDQCRGACYTTCSEGCRTGCSSSCGSGCASTCTGSCTNSCDGCGSGCGNYCYGVNSNCVGGGCAGNCTHECATWTR